MSGSPSSTKSEMALSMTILRNFSSSFERIKQLDERIKKVEQRLSEVERDNKELGREIRVFKNTLGLQRGPDIGDDGQEHVKQDGKLHARL